MFCRLMSLTCAVALLCSTELLAQTPATKFVKRLSELVRPFADLEAQMQAGPIVWPAARAVEVPTLTPPRYRGSPPAFPPRSARKEPRPGPLREGMPLARYRAAPELPEAAALPTEPLVRLIAPDVREPLPLPILAQPAKERAAASDPTLEASTAAALRPLAAQRTTPLPFVPLNLPDPFEYARGGRLRFPPSEDVMPPQLPARTPDRK